MLSSTYDPAFIQQQQAIQGTTLGKGLLRGALDKWRGTNKCIQDGCVYNQCIQAPLQQQTLVKPLQFQNICAPNSFVPPVRCKAYFNEGGFITKPVSRTYVLKPTLITRLKGLFGWRKKVAVCPPMYGGIGQTTCDVLPQGGMVGGFQQGWNAPMASNFPIQQQHQGLAFGGQTAGFQGALPANAPLGRKLTRGIAKTIAKKALVNKLKGLGL